MKEKNGISSSFKNFEEYDKNMSVVDDCSMKVEKDAYNAGDSIEKLLKKFI